MSLLMKAEIHTSQNYSTVHKPLFVYEAMPKQVNIALFLEAWLRSV